jgi:hypothetical protein
MLKSWSRLDNGNRPDGKMKPQTIFDMAFNLRAALQVELDRLNRTIHYPVFGSDEARLDYREKVDLKMRIENAIWQMEETILEVARDLS